MYEIALCHLTYSLLVFSGGTNDYYFMFLFPIGKWTGKDELIISGSSPEVEIRMMMIRYPRCI
jgi:hypothetical protein